ncbi:hypothetical protein D3C86_1872940 [compost metagenome]
MLAGAQLPAQHQPVVAGHHHIEHDQVDGVGFQEGAHLAAIGGNGGTQAVLLEIARHQLANFAIVVDDQDMIDVLHIGLPTPYVFNGNTARRL